VKGTYPLNTTKLHRVLLELLRHPEVHLTYEHMTAQQGHNLWDEIMPPTNLRIRVDANQQTGVLDHLGTVVHELLHVVVYPMSLGRLSDDLDEVLALALDAYMIAYIRKSPKRLSIWTEAINQKLIDSDKERDAQQG
jgi:hypothetical protein